MLVSDGLFGFHESRFEVISHFTGRAQIHLPCFATEA